MHKTTTISKKQLNGVFPNGLPYQIKTKSSPNHVVVSVEAKFLDLFWRSIETIKYPITEDEDYASALEFCIKEVESKYKIKLITKTTDHS